MASVKTAKGTDLPLQDIKGKPYLTVPYRVMWFNEEREGWRIETNIVEHRDDYSIVSAVVKDGSGNIIRTAHKQENKVGFLDHLEKAETGAIGRALGLLGYGTQFALELDEGDRIVDAPQPPKKMQSQPQPAPPKPQETSSGQRISDAQVKRLWTLQKKSKLSEKEIAEMIKMRFKKESSKELTDQDYKALCDVILASPLEG